MPLDFAKTVLQCGSELPIHQVLKQTLHDKGPSGLFTGMVSMSVSVVPWAVWAALWGRGLDWMNLPPNTV